MNQLIIVLLILIANTVISNSNRPERRSESRGSSERARIFLLLNKKWHIQYTQGGRVDTRDITPPPPHPCGQTGKYFRWR